MKTLRDLVHEQGRTTQWVAKKAKVTRSTIYAMYQKRKGIAFETVCAVCDALGITTDDYRKMDACPNAQQYAKDAEETP